MKIRFEVIEYELKVNAIHVSSNIVGGNIRLTLEYVPGTTLRGLIASRFLRYFCRNIETFVSSSCVKCESRNTCPFEKLFMNNEHGIGAYFHFGNIESDFSKSFFKGVSLNRRTKNVQIGKLFMYEVLRPLNGHLVVKSKVVIPVPKDVDIEEIGRIKKTIENCIKLTKYASIGGKKSWGFGLIENVSISSISSKEHVIREANDTEQVINIRTRTPLPIPLHKSQDKLEKVLEKALNHIVSKVLRLPSIRIQVEEAKIEGHYEILGISSWDIKENRRREPCLAIRNGTLRLKVKINGPQIINIRDLVEMCKYTGLTISGSWYTKTGYGVVEPVL
ncbi:MAG TPA: hypothetical protein ENG66_04420 [Thermococcus sp.]|nr:hypothetical protein [Thermococcus sp.]